MNEKNKNKQTFSDLFSNINEDNNEENKKVDFNSIKETTNNTLEEENETLESLFTKSLNQNKNEQLVPNIFKETASQSLAETTEEESKQPQDNESEKNNIFNEVASQSLEETTEEESKQPQDNESEKNNIFNEVASQPLAETNDKEQNYEVSNEENDIKSINSFPKIDFFENHNKDNQLKNSTTPSNNNLESNIFFNNETAENLTNKEIVNIEKENLSSNNNISLENNPFFEEESKESISPFFEEKKEEQQQNPFFDNKISLIENNKHNINQNNLSKIDTSNVKSFDVKIVKKKEPLLKFILGVISYAVFIWLLLIGITLLLYIADIKIRAAKGDNSPPKYNAYVVLTGSMLPEIQVYDVVITKKTDPKELEKGDVITFASSDTRFLNTIITHRIIKKNYDSKTNSYTFQTKGDNNNVADSALVQPNNIYGKVILKIPKLGYLQHFLASDGGWIIVILIPCLLVISYDIVKLIKGLKRKKYKNIKVQK